MSVSKKSVIWNAIGSTINSFSSLFFLIIVTRINGLNDAGIFTYCFSSACLLYIVGIYFGRAYQVTDNNEKYLDCYYVYNRITTCLLMILVTVIFLLIKKYDFYKTIIFLILCLFKCVEAFSECIYAFIQKKDMLDKVGKSLFLKAFLAVILFFIIDLITNNLILSCISIVIVNIFVLIFYDFKNSGKIKYEKFNFKLNNKILKKGFYTFAFSFLSLYVINAAKYAIDGILTEDKQAIYGIIIMPATVMSLLSQFIAQPYLLTLKNKLKENKIKEFIKISINILLAMTAIGSFCILAAYILGIPVLEIIYNVILKSYKLEFMIIMIGSLFYGINSIISIILITMRKTFCQFIILLITSLCALFLSKYLVLNYDILGASISYFIIMIVQFIMYTFSLIYCFKKI